MAEIKRAGENDIKRLVEKIHTRYGNVDNTADTNKNVASAKKLSTARTITLSGDASGSVSFDGSQDVSLSVTVKDDSHNHIISNIDGLQSALDGKLPSGGTAASATKLANSRTFSITGGVTASGVSFNGTGNVALNVTSIDPSKISGTIPLSKLPAGALEKLVVVDDQEAMYALTTAQVQLGDTVQVGENGPMYRVVDEANLDNATGYKIYTAGSASSVPWSGVTGKPGTFTPATHTHDIDDVSRLQSALNGKLSTTGTAAKATADASGQNIAGTYIKGLSVSGRTVTYTKGDGSTGSFQTQDTNTTYTLSSFGITATADEINKLDGLAVTKTELGYLDGVTSNIQSQLNGKLGSSATAAKANALATARNINGMSFDGSANRFNYGTCSTAAGTAAKTVACSGFSLATGAEITVKFTVTNTASGPTLNVNSTGAKPIYYNGAAISAGYLKANKTYSFRYNGTQYDLVGDVDTNTTYSLSSLGVTATAAELNKLDGLATTKTELGYLDGVTSNVQTQLNNKLSSTGTAAKATADSLGQNIADTYIKSLSVSGKVITYTKGDGGTGTITTQDTNTTYSNFKAATSSAAGGSGLVPAPAAGAQSKYLRGDGTWQTPPNTTYGNMTGASSSAAGKAGLVPAPAAGAQAKYLRGDGTWQTPTNTTYGAAGTSLGLVKSGGDVTIASGVITVNDDSHNHTIANVDGLQTKINNMTMDTDGSLADTD